MGSCSIKKKLSALVWVSCLCGGTLVSNPWKATAGDAGSETAIVCDIQQGACSKRLGDLTVSLDILPKPVMAMKDLTFTLKVSGKALSTNPFIDLGMPGMNMGPNRVELRRVKDNLFEGQGVIVRCPSGRRTWKATVTLPQAGKVEFVFDVLY